MWRKFLDRIFKAVLEIDTMSYVPSFHIRDVLAGVIVAGVIAYCL